VTTVLVAGAIAVGKTATAIELAHVLQARLVLVRQALADVLGISPDDRAELQRRGADLDQRTAGRWLRDYLDEAAETADTTVVDSLRTRRQTLPILESRPDSRLLYLDAHEETRRRRYLLAASTDPVKASLPFDAAMRHPTERQVTELRPLAHLVIETDEIRVPDVAREVLAAFGLGPSALDARP
jgi:hypothetical protein